MTYLYSFVVEFFNYIRIFNKKVGPGILYAGAAVGVSHLVNATKAGANFGTQLILAVIIIHILKYPFFQIATKYAAVTGNNLLEGYYKLHKSLLWITLIVTLATAFIIQAAVTLVTIGLLQELFHFLRESTYNSRIFWSCTLLIGVGALLILGSYHFTESFTKWIMLLLTVCTLIAFFFSYDLSIIKSTNFMTHFSLSDNKHLLFLIVLLGWMPAPFDVAIWQSIWTVKKKEKLIPHANIEQNMKDTNLDFHVGYWLTMFLACLFLLLGNNMLYGTSEELSSVGSIFAKQFVQFYTNSIGSWSYGFIIIAAITTMFSTILGCLNGFSNTLAEAMALICSPLKKRKSHLNFSLSVILMVLGTLYILIFSLKNMGEMIKVATSISFITTPFFAILNYLIIFNKNDSVNISLSKVTHIISILGILFFIISTIIYLKYIYFN